ncbi:MAG TPA: tetratricopeptide repeat protein [Chitinophagaceae bacterium]|nr:tetratricopeptide repeat protein [Chitinophagaceae bacterium]
MKINWLLLFFSISIVKISVAQEAISYSKLVERQGIVYMINSETPFTGKTFQLHSNGQKEFEGSYMKGVKNSLWTSWYSNGQKEFVGNYKNGNYDGRIRKYTFNGQTIVDAGYTNGILQGKCTLYYDDGSMKFNGWYEKGQYDSLITEYSSDGTLTTSAMYSNGVLNGDYWNVPPRGNRVKCVYKNGLLHGTYIEYHNTGKPALYGTYINGVKEGEFVYKYSDGSLYFKVNYINGLKEGEVIYYAENTYAPDSKMRAKMGFFHDKLNGKYIAWRVKGTFEVWFSVESDRKIELPGSVGYEKMEGCFVNGNQTGIFKFWKTDLMSGIPTNTYERQIWEYGKLIDNGWSDGGHIVEYNSDGSLTDYYKKYFQNDARFTKKYEFPCEMDFTNQQSEELFQDKFYNNSGDEKFKKNDFTGAIQDFTKAIELNPNFSNAYFNRALSRNKLQDFPGAISDYTKAIEINPEFDAAYYNRGNIYRSNKDFALAILDYNAAIKIDSDKPKYYLNLGLAKASINNHEDAIKDYDIGIMNIPTKVYQ